MAEDNREKYVLRHNDYSKKSSNEIIYVKSLELKHLYFDLSFSYSFDPLPGVEDCGQRTENEESLYAPRIAGIIIILQLLDYCINSQV